MHYDLIVINPNTVKPAVAPLGLEYVAEAARGADPKGRRAEFVELVQRARELCNR